MIVRLCLAQLLGLESLLGLVSLLALVLLGCGDPCTDLRINSTGTYNSIVVYNFAGVGPKNAFHHKRGKELLMTIYRDLGQVTFSYVRDQKTVEETWDCVGREQIDPNNPTVAKTDDAVAAGGGG